MPKRVLDHYTGPTIRETTRELGRRISSARSLAKEHGLTLKRAARARGDRGWILSKTNVLIDHGSIDEVERFLKDYRKPGRP
jgi:hypothetical protein